MNYNPKRWAEDTLHPGRLYRTWFNGRTYNCNSIWVDRDGAPWAELTDIDNGNIYEVCYPRVDSDGLLSWSGCVD